MLSSTCESVSDYITCVCFSTDGSFVIAGHRDGTVGVWLTAVSCCCCCCCCYLLLFTQSGDALFYTQTNKQVVSVTTRGTNRILTCHLNSSSLHSLSVTSSLLHTTRTIRYCNSRLRLLGVQTLDRVPFLQKFLTQLSAKLFKQHECEQVCINHNMFVVIYFRSF